MLSKNSHLCVFVYLYPRFFLGFSVVFIYLLFVFVFYLLLFGFLVSLFSKSRNIHFTVR